MTNNRDEAFPDNVPGRFFIDTTCINCGLCPSLAPEVFRESDDASHSFVHCQPSSPETLAQAEEAAALCPTASIKSDVTVPAAV